LGQVATLAAGGGTGKTWLALDLLQALGTGSPILGHTPPRPYSTLLLDRERGYVNTERRYMQLASGRGPGRRSRDWLDPRVNYYGDPLTIDSDKGFQEFTDVTDGYEIIIIDSLSKVFSDILSDSSARYMQRVRDLAHDRNCLFFFLHHTSQATMRGQNDQSPATQGKGNQAYTDNVDLLLVAKENSKRGVISATPGKEVLVTRGKANDVEVAPLVYLIEGERGGDTCLREMPVKTKEQQETQREATRQSEIITLVARHPGRFKRSQLPTELGRNRQVVLKEVRELVEAGHLEERDDSKLYPAPHTTE